MGAVDTSRVAIPVLGLGLLGGLTALGVLLHTPSGDPARTDTRPLAANLASIGLALSLSDAATVGRADVEAGRLVHMLVEDGDARLRLRVSHGLAPDEAERRIDAARQRLDALYGERQAPYPGELSNSLKCPDAFKPVDHTPAGTAASLVRLYANDRLAFGGCADELLTYHASVAQYYSPAQGRLVQAEYFWPRGQSSDPGPEILSSARLDGAP